MWFIKKNRLKAAILQVIAPSMDALGSAIVERARELVPVDTGKLRDSISYSYRQDTGQLQIHADMRYAIYIEMGTRARPATPYLRPALQAAPELWRTAKSVQLQFQTDATAGGQRAQQYAHSMNTSQVQSRVRLTRVDSRSQRRNDRAHGRAAQDYL